MKSASYRIEKLLEPEGDITHHLVCESSSKHKQSGGFGYREIIRGTYKECLERKKEIENENAKDDYIGTFRKK